MLLSRCKTSGVDICSSYQQTELGVEVIIINIKQELNTSKQKVHALRKQLSNCHNKEQMSHIEYAIQQELIKIEGYELLLDLSHRLGVDT